MRDSSSGDRFGVAVMLLALIGVVVTTLFLLLVLFTPRPFWERGSGQHTGYITATDNSGTLFKKKSVYFKTNTQSTQEDVYCVTDDSIYSELIKAQESGVKVTIEYTSYVAGGFATCGEHSEIIKSVK